jgi:hypothetical protein
MPGKRMKPSYPLRSWTESLRGRLPQTQAGSLCFLAIAAML